MFTSQQKVSDRRLFKRKLTELQKQIPVFVMDGKEFLKDMPDADEPICLMPELPRIY